MHAPLFFLTKGNYNVYTEPSQPTWLPQSCVHIDRYRVQLSWNKPLTGLECCAYYQLHTSRRETVTTYITQVIFDVYERTRVYVNCVGLTGMSGPRGSYMMIDPGAYIIVDKL